MSAYLFVPANRPDRFAKACATGTAAVILDWEDTVGAAEKAAARKASLAFDFAAAKAAARQELWLRLNSGAALAEDLAFLQSAPEWPVSALLLPKAEEAALVAEVSARTGKAVILLIETAKGVAAVRELAAADGVKALGFGLLDLGRDLRLSPNSAAAQQVFDRVRYELVLASALFGLQRPIETVFPDFAQTARFAQRARYAYQMGFGGQLCIHPCQVALAAAAFRPDEEQYALAEAVWRRFESSGSQAFSLDGMMVDKPLIEWARELLDNQAA